MPRIPTIDEPGVSTEPPNPPHLATDFSPLGQQGRALQTAGQVISGLTDQVHGMYEQAHQQAIAADVTDAETKLQAQTNAKLYDQQNGLMFKRGDQLFPDNPDGTKTDLGTQAFEDITKSRQEIADTLKDARARQMFLMRTSGSMEATHRSIEIHVGEQRVAAQQASSQGLQATAQDALANNFADPVERARLIAQPEASIKALALSPEDAAAKLAEWRSKANSTVLNQYIAAKDFKGAQAYFSQVKSDLGPQSATFEHAISTLQEKEQGRQTALSIIQASKSPTNGFVDDAKAVAAYEALPEGQMNEHTEQAFHQLLGLEKAAEVNKKSQVFDGAFTDLLKTHSLASVDPTKEAWLKANDPVGWARLESMGRRDEAAPASPNETANYATVVADIEKNPLKYKGMAPSQFTYAVAGQVSPRDLKTLVNKFSEAQRKPDFALQGSPATTVTDIFRKAYGAPKNQKDWNPDQLALWRDVHDYVEQQANVYIRDHNGKVPQEQELSKWASDKLVKGSVVGGGRIYGDANGVTRAEAETLTRYQGKPFQEDIPADGRKTIMEKFKARGMAKPTEAQVRSVYEAMKGAASGSP